MQKQVKLRIVDKTVFVTTDTHKYRGNLSKDQKDKLKKFVEKYNEKPTEFYLSKIKKMFVVNETVSIEKIERKKAKHKAKEVVQEAKEQVQKSKLQVSMAAEIAELIAAGVVNDDTTLVEAARRVQEKVAKKDVKPSTGYRRPGEY